MSQEIKLQYGDIAFYGGEPILLDGNAKLEQDLGKVMLTELNGYFHPNYGSAIYDMIGQYETPNILDTMGRKATLDALNYFAQIQYRQGLQQTLTPQEVLGRINSMNISRNKNNPDSYLVTIIYKDGTGNPATISVPIT
jgi:hypothetical protein